MVKSRLEKVGRILKKLYGRDYDLYVVGFVKNRKKIQKTFKDQKRAELLYIKYKEKFKYKSAYFRIDKPIRDLLSKENVLLSKLKTHKEPIVKAIVFKGSK